MQNSTDRHHSTTRFSDRVEAYVKYRPGYPDALITTLREYLDLDESTVIVDIGSGTGISAELFLRHGMTVYGVEPNQEMREAAESGLDEFDGFHSIAATAEQTSLGDSSIDLVAAGQAFHWFDREAIRKEWKRILKPDGHVVLFWNSRRTESSPFLRAYEEMLLEFGTDYQQINHQNITDDDIVRFFEPNPVETVQLYNEQLVDFEGLRGRLESSSYAPAPGHTDYEPMIERLKEIFKEFEVDDRVCIEYDLVVYIGKL